MLSLGCCLLLLANDQDRLGAGAIDLVKDSGFDYAEVSLARIYPLSEQEFADYLKKFQDAKLPVEVFNNSFPMGLKIIGPQREEKVIDAYIQRAVALAKAMGVEIITMCGPIRDMAPADFSWEEEGIAQYTNFLQKFSVAAAEEGLTLAIEPIWEAEHGCVNTLKQALEIIRPMKMDNLKLMVDLFHMAKQGDDFQYLLDICKDWVVHVHFAEIEGRVYPIEANKKQYENIIRQMVEHGYRGRISVEAHAPNMKQDLPAAYTVLSECVKEAVENGK